MAPIAACVGARSIDRRSALQRAAQVRRREASMRSLSRTRDALVDPRDRRGRRLHRLPARLLPQGRRQVLQVGWVHAGPMLKQLLGAAQCPLFGGHDVAGENLVDGRPSSSSTGWMYSIEMESVLNPYRCRQCGAASYARLVHRGPDGAMGYADRYRCSGCPLTFSDRSEWRVQNEPHANSQLRVVRGAQQSSPHTSGGL